MRRLEAAARSPACQGSGQDSVRGVGLASAENPRLLQEPKTRWCAWPGRRAHRTRDRQPRSEEHTSELQSPCNLVCRLLLEKKKKKVQQSGVRRQQESTNCNGT